MNISEELKKLGISCVLLENESIFSEHIDEKIEELKKADFIVFASKHQGKTEKMLSMHAPGNWRKADFGGEDRKVCRANANVMKIFFQELNKNTIDNWKTTMECTHHGPLIEKPCLFIEIGSNKENWKSKEAALFIANVIKNSIERINKEKMKKETAIAIGGPHYCPNFNKIQLNSEVAVSHVIPRYALPLTKEMLEEAINKTQESVSLVLLDWKGCGKSQERQKVIQLIEKTGLKWKKTSDVEK
jgi:D-aminoacyl-tRNA deacylase